MTFDDHSYHVFTLGFFLAGFWQCIIGWYCAWAWEWKCSLAYLLCRSSNLSFKRHLLYTLTSSQCEFQSFSYLNHAWNSNPILGQLKIEKCHVKSVTITLPVNLQRKGDLHGCRVDTFACIYITAESSGLTDHSLIWTVSQFKITNLFWLWNVSLFTLKKVMPKC